MQTFEEFYYCEKEILNENIIQNIANNLNNASTYLGDVVGWIGNSAAGAAGGVVAANLMGSGLIAMSKKLAFEVDQEAQKQQAANQYLVSKKLSDAENEAVKKGQALTDEQQRELFIKFSEELAKKYKIPQAGLFIKGMRKVGEVLKGKLGSVFGAILGFLVFKLAIPFPTL